METFQNGGQRLSINCKKRRFGNTLTSQPLMAHPGAKMCLQVSALPGLVLTVKNRSLNAWTSVVSLRSCDRENGAFWITH